MSAVVAATPPSTENTTDSHVSNNHRRSHRNRQNGRQRTGTQETPESSGTDTQSNRRRGRGAKAGGLSLRPSTLPPRSHNGSSGNAHPQQTADETNAPASAPSQTQQPRMVNGRTFGGKLTNTEASGSTAGLQADAVEFVPGQPLINNQRSQQRSVNSPKKRRPSKSTAPDILTRTHEDIEHGQYECPICTSEIQRKSKIWSCHTCWTVFHLTCIKKWAGNEGSVAAQRQSAEVGETPPARQWRCPGCNLPKDDLPRTYACWCGKETDPRPPTGIPPHSCGNTCSKDRVRKCPHPCQLICHAGPCPPCTYMGPTQICFCGKNETTRKCSETDYENGWSCEENCGDIMPCGIHTCPRPCHEGLCGACEESVTARCFCGQEEHQLPCNEQLDPQESSRRDSLEPNASVQAWIGTFKCPNPCDRQFDCGKHRCEKPCHSQDTDVPHCPKSPDQVTTCPCGKTDLSALLDLPRSSCSDPIPNCKKRCGRLLSCGHGCTQLCHTGECLPCLQSIQISCVCGRTTSTTICHQGNVEQPQCMRVCRATLSCGRHACDERCCSGEKKATERLSTKKQRRPLGSAAPPLELIEAEHICTRVCGRPLKCGNHECQELCHKGPCGSCREAIFDEVTCDCGRTKLEPPLPCGTKPPPCRFQCERSKACGHPQVQHTCHSNDERCPKCPFLVERRCMCGKKLLKNQPCWLQDSACGQTCGRKLRCGLHFCRKACHKAGECEDSDGRPCQQPCGKPKQTCGHPDENTCHAPYACKEDKPCTSKIFITCDCQAQRQEARCGASKQDEGNQTKKLSCNDECAKLERNRRLAVALNIDQSSHVDGGDHIPYSEETLNLFAQHQQWCQNQERECRVFADSPDEKRFRFKPMSAGQRAFLHALADDFGFDSESLDPEPHRHVLLLKTPRFVSAPNKTLAESLRIRVSQRALQIRQPVVEKAPSTSTTTPFNALVITAPRFGLIAEEIRSALLLTDPPTMTETIDISFLPSEEVILRLKPGSEAITSASSSPTDLEAHLGSIKPGLAAVIADNNIGTLRLCAVDHSLNVVRREADHEPGAADGWSRVAAKGAATPRRAPQPGSRASTNTFSALIAGSSHGGSASSAAGGKVTFAKRKAVKKDIKPSVESVVDDWEAEMEAEESAKAKASSNADDDADAVAANVKANVEAETVNIKEVEEETIGGRVDASGEGHEGQGTVSDGSALERDEVDGHEGAQATTAALM